MNDKNGMTFWTVFALMHAIIFGIMIFCGYISGNNITGGGKSSHLIGASYMTMNNEFYKIMGEEISARVEAEGDRLILRDPALDSERQIGQINEMLDAGIDVLVVAPVDWESLTYVLEKAQEKGVMIVVVDTNVYDEHLVDCTITSDNYNAGVIIGEYFLQQCEKAKVVVMTHEAAKSGQDRVQGFLDTVENQKGIEIVQKIECEGQLEIAMPKLQEAIDQGIVFDNIFCLNDLASVGVVAALEDNHLLDGVSVFGVDASPDSKALIKEKMMMASVAQFPSDVGSRTANAIYKLLKGEKVEKNILVPVQLVTRDNVDSFGIDRWQ